MPWEKPYVNSSATLSENISTRFETAEDWGLNPEEWDRYLQIMKGKARYFATNMPPAMVLGMYTENTDELKRYAEMLAQFEKDKQERIIKIQLAYDDANRRLYPNNRIANLETLRDLRLLSRPESEVVVEQGNLHQIRFGDKVAFFADKNCEICISKLESIALRYPSTSVEVFFKGTNEEFTQWIKSTTKSPNWFSTNNIGFSRDDGQSASYDARSGSAYIIRGKELYEADI